MNIIIDNCQSKDSGLDGFHIEGYVNLTANNIIASGNKGSGITIGSYNPELKRLISDIHNSIKKYEKFSPHCVAINQVLQTLSRDADNLKSNKPALILGFRLIESLAVECEATETILLMKKGREYTDSMK